MELLKSQDAGPVFKPMPTLQSRHLREDTDDFAPLWLCKLYFLVKDPFLEAYQDVK